MAKKNKNLDDLDLLEIQDEDKTGSKIVTILITLVIVFLCLAIFTVLIKLDVGGVGSKIMRPVLKDVPGINKILPAAADDVIAEENNYDYKNLSEAVARIKELESQVNTMTTSQTDNSTYIPELEAEVQRLKQFEDNQKVYEQKLLEFETDVIFNEKAPDISEYMKYYEGISPDNAAEIYRQVLEQNQIDTKVIEQGERYTKMEPATAASILEVMTGDIDLVTKILESMTTSKSALILEQMDPEMAAQLTKKMSYVD